MLLLHNLLTMKNRLKPFCPTFSYGTKKFTILVSDSLDTNWTFSDSHVLSDVKSLACEQIPLNNFEINSIGRYIKITLDSFYESGAGLQHVDVNVLGYSGGKCN